MSQLSVTVTLLIFKSILLFIELGKLFYCSNILMTLCRKYRDMQDVELQFFRTFLSFYDDNIFVYVHVGKDTIYNYPTNQANY